MITRKELSRNEEASSTVFLLIIVQVSVVQGWLAVKEK